MLPPLYGILADLTLVVGGAVACFAGYRLFRIVLGIYGFVLGAMFASSMMGATSAGAQVIAAIIGGLIGAVILTFAYFLGVALLGAGLGALVVAPVLWRTFGSGDPPALAVILLAVAGSLGAMLLQRYVVIVTTAFGGSWTMLVGLFALLGDRGAARAAPSGNVSILYPTTVPDQSWVPIVAVVTGVIGAIVQLGITARERRAA